MVPADCSDFTAHWPGKRQALAAIASEKTADYSGSGQSRCNAKALADPRTFAVVCGQQPALGGGPLYSLVKCADAIARCQSLASEGSTNQSAVPIFWCASDDHDAGEADHADLIKRDGSILRVRDPINPAGAALHRQAAATHWPKLLSALEQLEGPRLGKAWLVEHSPLSGEGLGAWLCRLLCTLFGQHGLLCLEAKDLRPLWRDHIAKTLDNWPIGALADLRQQLLSQGKSAIVPAAGSSSMVERRAHLRRAVDSEEARSLLTSNPDQLSPGAALRPILQQLALPAAIYCAGPGELAYHAFLPPIYEALSAPKPQLSERHHISLVDAWCSRGLQRWGITASDLAPDKALPEYGITTKQKSQEALAILKRAHDELERLTSSNKDEDFAKRLIASMNKLKWQQKTLASSLARGARRQAGITPTGALRNWLYPRDQPQERIMSSVQAIWHYGPGLANNLVNAAHTGVSELLIDQQ